MGTFLEPDLNSVFESCSRVGNLIGPNTSSNTLLDSPNWAAKYDKGGSDLPGTAGSNLNSDVELRPRTNNFRDPNLNSDLNFLFEPRPVVNNTMTSNLNLIFQPRLESVNILPHRLSPFNLPRPDVIHIKVSDMNINFTLTSPSSSGLNINFSPGLHYTGVYNLTPNQ